MWPTPNGLCRHGATSGSRSRDAVDPRRNPDLDLVAERGDSRRAHAAARRYLLASRRDPKPARASARCRRWSHGRSGPRRMFEPSAAASGPSVGGRARQRGSEAQASRSRTGGAKSTGRPGVLVAAGFLDHPRSTRARARRRSSRADAVDWCSDGLLYATIAMSRAGLVSRLTRREHESLTTRRVRVGVQAHPPHFAEQRPSLLLEIIRPIAQVSTTARSTSRACGQHVTVSGSSERTRALRGGGVVRETSPEPRHHHAGSSGPRDLDVNEVLAVLVDLPSRYSSRIAGTAHEVER